MSKPIDGTKLVEDLNKKKKEIKKEGNKEMKKTILTVVITLVSVALMVGIFLFGMSFGASQERSFNDRLSAAKAASVIATEQSKK